MFLQMSLLSKLFASMYVGVCMTTTGARRTLDPLEFKLQVSCHVGAGNSGPPPGPSAPAGGLWVLPETAVLQSYLPQCWGDKHVCHKRHQPHPLLPWLNSFALFSLPDLYFCNNMLKLGKNYHLLFTLSSHCESWPIVFNWQNDSDLETVYQRIKKFSGKQGMHLLNNFNYF